MKTIIVTISILLISVTTAFGQTPPTPPETHTSTSSSSSYSFTYDTDDSSSNSCISIKNNNDIYRFKASFTKKKTATVKQLLVKHFGKRNLKITGNTYVWNKNQNGDEVFECKLTNGRLQMFVDKELVSGTFFADVKDLGVRLKDEITGSDSKKEVKKNAERALERAKRELERAKQNLDRAKRKSNK